MKISVCIPMYNENRVIAATAKTLSDYMASHFTDYEILFCQSLTILGGDHVYANLIDLVVIVVIFQIFRSNVQGFQSVVHHAADVAVLDQVLLHHEGRIHGNGKRQALLGLILCIDDTDELSVKVKQSSTRVARVDRRIGLNQGHDRTVGHRYGSLG